MRKYAFFAPANTLGYGVHSYSLMKALTDNGDKLAMFPPNGSISRPVDKYIEQWIKNQMTIGMNDPAVMIYHEGFMRHFSGSPRIGFPVFELEILRPNEIPLVQSCDFLLQPTEWGKQVLINNGIRKKVYVVPEGYDPDIFYPSRTADEMVSEMADAIRFIHIGKYEARKSTDEIIQAWTNAVSAAGTPKTALTLHINDPFRKDWAERASRLITSLGWQMQQPSQHAIEYKKGEHRIELITVRMNTQQEVAKLLSKAHFGIWASKAEGWNLPLVEAIACGVPSFTTPWTGMSEYVNPEVWGEELIFSTHTEVEAKDDVWFPGGRGNWKCPDVSEMTSKISAVLMTPETSYRKHREGATRIAKELTWKNSATAFNNAMAAEGLI